MKSLKFLIPALAFCVMAFVPTLQAQDKKGKGAMNLDAMVARLDEAVTLTADQKPKAKDIYGKVISDTQALSQEDRRTKGMEIRQAANKEIRALLTEDQQKKFDAMPPPARGGKKKNQ